MQIHILIYMCTYIVYIVFIDRASARATQRRDRKRLRNCEMCLEKKCVKRKGEERKSVQVNHNSNT